MFKKKDKVKKPQGPIRFSAIIPLCVFLALVVAFNIFFLDGLIKKAIEWGGTEANGAEVNVGEVHTSFRALEFQVDNIKFTNKEKPTHNLFEVGTFRFHMLWDALLRGKVAIDLAELADIKVDTKRARPGFVPPPPKVTTKTKVLGVAKKEFEGNVFGDIASVAGGASAQDTGSAIKEGLESEKKFKEVDEKIKSQKAKLEKSFKDLPSQSELKKLETRLKDIRWNDLSNLMKAPGVIKEAESLKKDIDQALNKFKTAESELKNSDKILKQAYKDAENAVEGDIAAVKSRMKIPSMDPTSIARGLFGNEIFQKVDQLKLQYAKIQKYLPPKKTGPKQKDLIKPERGEGKNYSFGTPKSYPLFWMKLAKINSSNEQGTVAGKIENLTTNQIILGKLTTAEVVADFPPQEIRGVKAKITVDHRAEPQAMIEGRIGSFPVVDKVITKSSDVTFVLKKAQVESTLNATVTPKKADIRIGNSFSKIDYLTKAKSPVVDEVLKDVASRTNLLTLDAKVTGKWNALGFDIKSNLAQAIESSVRGLVQAKIKAMEEKIRRDIEKEVAKQKAQVQSQIDKVTGKYKTELNKVENELNKVKGQLKSEEKKAKKQAKKAEKDFKKNLFKGIKI